MAKAAKSRFQATCLAVVIFLSLIEWQGSDATIIDKLQDVLAKTKAKFKKDTCNCQCREYWTTKCSVEYKTECKQLYTHRECKKVPVPVQMKVKETECQKCIKYYTTSMKTEKKRQCMQVYDEKCVTKYPAKCIKEEQCTTLYATVCSDGHEAPSYKYKATAGHDQNCRKVPKQSCAPVTKCHRTPRTRCKPTRDKECKTVSVPVPQKDEHTRCLPFEPRQLPDLSACTPQSPASSLPASTSSYTAPAAPPLNTGLQLTPTTTSHQHQAQNTYSSGPVGQTITSQPLRQQPAVLPASNSYTSPQQQVGNNFQQHVVTATLPVAAAAPPPPPPPAPPSSSPYRQQQTFADTFNNHDSYSSPQAAAVLPAVQTFQNPQTFPGQVVSNDLVIKVQPQNTNNPFLRNRPNSNQYQQQQPANLLAAASNINHSSNNVQDDIIDLVNPVKSVDSYDNPSSSDGFNPSPQIPMGGGGGFSAISHAAMDVGARPVNGGFQPVQQVQPSQVRQPPAISVNLPPASSNLVQPPSFQNSFQPITGAKSPAASPVPVQPQFVQSMQIPSAAAAADAPIRHMKKMRFPEQNSGPAVTVAPVTEASNTPPLTTPLVTAPIEIILEPKYEPLERPEVPLTDSLKPIVVDMTASGELKWTDVEPDVFEAAAKPEVQLNDALRPIVIDMTGRGNEPSSPADGNSLRPEVVDLTSPGQEDEDYSDDDYTDEEEVVLNIEDEELVNDILMNLEILKARGQAQELNNDPSDIMDLLFEGANTDAGGDKPSSNSSRKRRKNAGGRKRVNRKNRKRKNRKKRRRRIRLNGPSFGDKIKDVVIYY